MILSHTLMNTFEICPHQMFRRYIAKDLPVEKTDAMEAGSRVHKALEERLRRKIPLPADLQRLECFVSPLDQVQCQPEQKLGVNVLGRPVDFFADDVFLRGVLDAAFLLATDTAILLDWKTGKPREDAFELELGALLLQAHRPEVTNLYGQYVWLRQGRRGRLHNLSDTKRTWARVQAYANEIDNARYSKTPGPLCGWCPVEDCEHNRRAA